MLTPEGLSASKTDKIMLLAMWAKFIVKEQKSLLSKVPDMIYAGMGKPTYPLHPHTKKFLAEYWGTYSDQAIDYGHPQGDVEARIIMAEAMSKWYDIPIDEKEILFTVGGAGALRSIFCALKSQNEDTPNFRVITPFPYYTLYADNDLNLHPIHVMDSPGYHLTAKSLLASIQSAKKLAKLDQCPPKAVLLCDPNNPLGTVLGREELEKIAQVLREHPDLTIILDEAYAEMILDGSKHVSLLTVAPDLKERIILMRSATKGLSAAGERMAVTLAFNKQIMNSILQHSIRNYGHAPRSLQMAYAQTMANFKEEDRVKLAQFYSQKVSYVDQRLKAMGAAMPDPKYRVDGTFYILVDLSELMGVPLPESTYRALNKQGLINSDEDITYFLLFEDAVMIAPTSYYGVDKNKGYMRITCSEGEKELGALLDRIEARLNQVRIQKQATLKQNLTEQLKLLKDINAAQFTDISTLLNNINDQKQQSILELKQNNKLLNDALLRAKLYINRSSDEGMNKAATLIQSLYRGHAARKKVDKLTSGLNKEWFGFVDEISPDKGDVRSYLQQLKVTERLELTPWRDHLKEKNKSAIKPDFFMSMMASPTLNDYCVFLLFILLASSLTVACGIATLGATAIAAAAMVGVGSTLMGIGLFSQSIKNYVAPESANTANIANNIC